MSKTSTTIFFDKFVSNETFSDSPLFRFSHGNVLIKLLSDLIKFTFAMDLIFHYE